ncbi:MAG: GNAT family N-acetyltransferase [Burkholderiales bacterium]
MTLNFETHDSAPPDEARVVDAGLAEANLAAAPLDKVKALSCFARDASGAVVGGAVGRTWGECCELQQLWVAPAHREQGVGARLVRRFEARARERGCRTFYLTTFSFQAPAFYKALGYSAAHEIRGFPSGIGKYLMTRTVATDEG